MGRTDWAGRRPSPRASRNKATLVAAATAVLLTVASGCSSAQQPPAGSKQLTIWLTGYSWQDNTPPGSSKVGEPVLHQQASGQGTFADPITVAVPGHKGSTAWPPGTKFYLPTVQRYVIVEDSGAAKPPAGADTHLDMWIDGQDGTKQSTDDCEDQFTGNVPAQVNPPDGLTTTAGPIYANQKCNIPAQPDDLGGTYKNNDDGGNSDDSHHGHHNDDDSDSDSGGN